MNILIENIEIEMLHRKSHEKIGTTAHNEKSYSLGKKEIDDTFKIKFISKSEIKFLVFHKKNEYYEYIGDDQEIVSTEISLHRRLILLVIKRIDEVAQYELGIKHENHQSFFYFTRGENIQIFLHSNGLPDSKQIDRHKNHFLLNKILLKIEESQLK